MRSLYLSYSPAPGHGPVQFTLRPSCDCCCCSGIQPCRSSTAQMLTTPDKNLESKTWGVGGITEDCTWREKRERTEREREPAASKSCPVVAAMPRAKQAFYQFLGFRFILVLWVFLPHKSVHDSSCEEHCSAWSICWITATANSSRPHEAVTDFNVNSDANRTWVCFQSLRTSKEQVCVELSWTKKWWKKTIFGLLRY